MVKNQKLILKNNTEVLQFKQVRREIVTISKCYNLFKLVRNYKMIVFNDKY